MLVFRWVQRSCSHAFPLEARAGNLGALSIPAATCGCGGRLDSDAPPMHHQAVDTSTTADRRSSSSAASVPVLFSILHPAIVLPMLFEISGRELSDAEIAAVFRDIIAGAGRYPSASRP